MTYCVLCDVDMSPTESDACVNVRLVWYEKPCVLMMCPTCKQHGKFTCDRCGIEHDLPLGGVESMWSVRGFYKYCDTCFVEHCDDERSGVCACGCGNPVKDTAYYDDAFFPPNVPPVLWTHGCVKQCSLCAESLTGKHYDSGDFVYCCGKAYCCACAIKDKSRPHHDMYMCPACMPHKKKEYTQVDMDMKNEMIEHLRDRVTFLEKYIRKKIGAILEF